MFTIYASRSSNALVMTCTAHNQDKAAQMCVNLLDRGFTIHRVVLPDGLEVAGDKIEVAVGAARANKRSAA